MGFRLIALRVILCAAIIAALGSGLAGHSIAAGASADPRFGLVNAFDAPDAAFESGASWELLTIRWDALQPGGPADWAPSQALEDWLSQARQAGREVVAVLVGTPAWATDGTPGVGVPRGLYLSDADVNNVWANFARQVAGYYGARGINRFVIWDSPNIQTGAANSQWEGTAEDYYQLVRIAYITAKGANPSAIIHLGTINDSNPAWFGHFLDVVVADSGASANNYYFDVVSVEAFNSTNNVYTLAGNPSYLMNQAGMPLKPVWVTRTNARPAIDPSVYPPDATFRQGSKITLDQQAAFIVQTYALAFASGADRIAVYRLADNLAEDGNQAFGLVRSEGDMRPAFSAYQLVVEQFAGYKLARRVDEQAHPLIEYVRLTFPEKVTHVAWARTIDNATLIIPARSEHATLIRLDGERWPVKPEGGIYKLVVGGADCNDPATVGGCLIGGAPWILVEENVDNPLGEAAPDVTTELGGTVATPDPGPYLTQTALAIPTDTPTPTDTAIPPTDTRQPPTATNPAADTAPPEAATPTSGGQASAVTPTLSAADIEAAIRPQGFQGMAPYLLIGLGVLVIGGGAWFFWAGQRKPKADLVAANDSSSEIVEHGLNDEFSEAPSPEDTDTDGS